MHKKLAGFTLLETLMAILVLVLAISGPLIIAQKGLAATMIAKDQIIGYYLAQDAIEFVRYSRDSSCLDAQSSPCPTTADSNGKYWYSVVQNCLSGTSGTCQIDTINNSVTSCGGSACITPINYDSTLHTYNYTTGIASIYTRTIAMTLDSTQTELVVTVTVTWRDVGGKQRQVQIVDTLRNWQ